MKVLGMYLNETIVSLFLNINHFSSIILLFSVKDNFVGKFMISLDLEIL